MATTRLQSANDWFRFCDASGEHLLQHEQLQRIRYSEHQLRLQTCASNNCSCLYYMGFFLHYLFGASYFLLFYLLLRVIQPICLLSLIFRLYLFDSVFFIPPFIPYLLFGISQTYISRFRTAEDGVRSQGSSYGFIMEKSALDEVICENCCIRLSVNILLLRHIQTHLSA